MYVEELKRELQGRQLEIWNGTSGLSGEKEDQYRRLWRRQAAGATEGVRPAGLRPVQRPTQNRCNCKGAANG